MLSKAACVPFTLIFKVVEEEILAQKQLGGSRSPSVPCRTIEESSFKNCTLSIKTTTTPLCTTVYKALVSSYHYWFAMSTGPFFRRLLVVIKQTAYEEYSQVSR